MDYRLLDSDSLIEEAVRHFETLPAIAVDFECEFNLHIYGEHLCLVQIFTGSEYFVIDPRSESVTGRCLGLFFSSRTQKVWFDCHSDISLVFRNYAFQVNDIYDIRVPAKLLGFDGNLLSLEEHFLGITPSFSKKKNQTANWLKRPVPAEQMEYALADVAHLLELKPVLEEEIRKAGLEEECVRQMKLATAVKAPSPGWKRLPGWKNMSRRSKVYAKWLFIARDKVAERFNVPPSRVLDKHLLVRLAENPPATEQLETALRPVSPRFRAFMLESAAKALAKAEAESAKRA